MNIIALRKAPKTRDIEHVDIPYTVNFYEPQDMNFGRLGHVVSDMTKTEKLNKKTVRLIATESPLE